MAQRILLLPGDGIGPEVVRSARLCLNRLNETFSLDLTFDEADFGGIAIDKFASSLPEATLRAAKASDAVLLGAVGGKKWDQADQRPEAGLLDLRKQLGLFANLRPVKVLAGMEHLSPLKAERVSGADFVVVRELTGGLYFGEKTRFENDASDVCAYSRAEIERIAVIAFETAAQRRGLVTSVDKANVLATSKLWRDVVSDVAKRFSSVELEHLYVDAAAMELVTNPKRFDVILTENLFGDILSDEASVVPGSIGLLGSASLGEGGPGVFEPIHGSAPDIAGEDAANPLGMLASTVLMLRYGLDQAEAADALERACEAQLREGSRTRDVGGSASTSEVTAEVVARLPG